MIPTGFRRVNVAGAGCRISVLDGGDPQGDAVIVIHGMRDHAAMMAFLVDHLPDYRLLLPDLRGHGDSEHSNSYTAVQLVADLKAVQQHFQLEQFDLVGHSLGGHIASRFTLLYPGLVQKLALLDGMGPPMVPDPDGEKVVLWRSESWRSVIDALLAREDRSRVMADKAEALSRFRNANPQLSEERARLFVDTGTRPVEGGIKWKFGTNLEMFWTGVSTVEHEQMLFKVSCPVLIATGERGLDYWTANRPELVGQTALYESEIERRVSLFPNARHELIPDAGHMLHYDQPDKLGSVLRNFLLDD